MSIDNPYEATNTVLYYLDILNKPILNKTEDDEYYIVEKKYENRPDLLSHHLYGTDKFWYVFMLRNMDIIEDPIYDLIAGIEIRIPTLQNVNRITFENSTNIQ